MKTTTSVLAITFLLAGCTTDGAFKKRTFKSTTCGAVSGYTRTKVRYGDGKIVVVPKSTIRAGTEWRFYLVPIPSLGGSTAYGASTVTIDGKAAGSMVLPSNSDTLVPYVIPSPPNNDNWLSASGTYNTASTDNNGKRYLSFCVDPDVQRDQDWYYKVTIQHVGEVDPRGHVE